MSETMALPEVDTPEEVSAEFQVPDVGPFGCGIPLSGSGGELFSLGSRVTEREAALRPF